MITLEEWKVRRANAIAYLMEHFNGGHCKQGYEAVPYTNEESLLVDMLDDVIDVWIDDHRKEWVEPTKDIEGSHMPDPEHCKRCLEQANDPLHQKALEFLKAKRVGMVEHGEMEVM